MSGQRKQLAGLSLAEVLIAAGLFAVFSAVLAVALKQSSSLWLSNSSQLDASARLRKVAVQLERDFPMARVADSGTSTVPASLSSGGYDGDAVWFLSHINPTDEKAHILSDGTPFWQCHVLYYCVVPRNVETLVGGTVPDGKDADNYEDRCSYKVLIRKVIDVGTATDPTDESTAETLMPNADAYLTRPDGYDTSSMTAEPGVMSVEIVATKLLLFRAKKDAAPSRFEFDIRALSVEAQQKVAKNPSGPLLESPYTLQSLISVSARN